MINLVILRSPKATEESRDSSAFGLRMTKKDFTKNAQPKNRTRKIWRRNCR